MWQYALRPLRYPRDKNNIHDKNSIHSTACHGSAITPILGEGGEKVPNTRGLYNKDILWIQGTTSAFVTRSAATSSSAC